jgi:dTDP-4-dehydrorhamnose 3,5-epimerase
MKNGLPRLIKINSFKDHRGVFTRVFDDLAHLSHNRSLRQINLSLNPHQFTLRGMHFQISGNAEDKLIKVVSGQIYCVVSNAHLVNKKSQIKNYYFNLEANVDEILFIPSTLATGWITLKHSTNLIYMMTARYEDCNYGGFKYSDNWAEINWPYKPSVISQKDLKWNELR